MNTINAYNKLGCDKIPEICEACGVASHTRIIESDQEYLGTLCNELVEEAQEVKEDPSLEELADRLEEVRSITKVQGYTPEQIEAKRVQKAQERVGFEDRIV